MSVIVSSNYSIRKVSDNITKFLYRKVVKVVIKKILWYRYIYDNMKSTIFCKRSCWLNYLLYDTKNRF